jgi:hypothetical protein
MNRRFALLFAGLCALPASAPLQAQNPDWEANARSDISAAFVQYRTNHPGWDDPANPGFRKQLEAARDAGLAKAAGADSREDYAAALAAFNAELSDGHARLLVEWPKDADGPKALWPGFVAAWRGQQAIVHSAAPGSGWVVGSVFAACDGRPFAEFARERIAQMGGRPSQDGQWWARMPTVFSATATDLPAHRCTVVEPDGRAVERTLAWAPPPPGIDALRRAAGEGDTLPIGLTQPAPGIAWIALPSFSPDDEGKAAYDQLFADLKANRRQLATARAVVIDLRANQGGSSLWSREVAQRLWGEAAVTARMESFFSNVSIWWRATPDNLAYLAELVPLLADRPETAAFVRKAHEGMAAAITRGQTYWVEPEDEERANPPPSPATAFETPVYVITPGQCASACLDAVDTFTRFPHVTLIGAPTSADSTYLEVRRAALPSGQGEIVIPLKVWRGRPRPSGFVYQPRIRIDDPAWTQRTFLAAIEKDLGAR